MRVATRPFISLPPVAVQARATAQPKVDTFQASEAAPSTSWFHKVSGGIAGGTVGTVAGFMAMAALGNGHGAEGLIYPLIGLGGGGLAGMVAGSTAAKHFHSEKGKTSLFHRASGLVAGGALGGVLGAVVLAPLGNGIGAEGLVYPFLGLVGGGLAGSVAGAVASGHFPDKR